MSKYLKEFRVKDDNPDKMGLYPFTKKAATEIGIISGFNASKIFQFACNLLDYALETGYNDIDEKVVAEFSKQSTYKIDADKKEEDISTTQSLNLIDKANEKS